MVSSFSGLETAKRGLFAQQSALYATGHNIANANTEGYTRQRVNFEQTSPFPPASRNRPEITGQIGSGVRIGAIERIRDNYLDVQYRSENNNAGYFEARASELSRLEEIMNEPLEDGLSKTMDRFWQALQDLSVNPEHSGARSVVVEQGKAVTDTFNYLSKTLINIQGDIAAEVDITTKTINSIAQQINSLNGQIASVEPHGPVPNDLYDQRDLLIDKLSSLVNINVTYESTPSSADALARGKVNISLVDAGGKELTSSLVNGADQSVNALSVTYNDRNLASTITLGGREMSVEEFTINGKLKGLIDTGGYVKANGEDTGTYEKMLSDLDKLATGFAEKFNEVHRSGQSLRTISNGGQPPAFFEITGKKNEAGIIKGLAGRIEVTDEIKEDIDHIAAASIAEAGNGNNAKLLAEVQHADDELFGEKASMINYYESMIGSMAVEAQEAARMQGNTATLTSSVEQRRMSVSAVSLDEEMTNMIKFQHAYNASARNITTIDEMLDRIINQMGVVGR
ncbi:flagellar hook-associated protein FlgK [Halobacillus massiliensis]|uniref:flagellar hook-associated protein FlgK n=1 Tax=Halobacillus massiliensis TaxID=1926286 RepID=UPI0009E4DA2F|nr:flagellar hook-associated protein FlgK [Halobacillus massiliensis]